MAFYYIGVGFDKVVRVVECSDRSAGSLVGAMIDMGLTVHRVQSETPIEKGVKVSDPSVDFASIVQPSDDEFWYLVGAPCADGIFKAEPGGLLEFDEIPQGRDIFLAKIDRKSLKLVSQGHRSESGVFTWNGVTFLNLARDFLTEEILAEVTADLDVIEYGDWQMGNDTSGNVIFFRHFYTEPERSEDPQGCCELTVSFEPTGYKVVKKEVRAFD